MDTVIQSKVASGIELKWFNQCRLYLKIWSLADIATSDGAFIRDDILNGNLTSSTSQKLRWPLWGKPKREAWAAWRNY